MLSSDEMYKLVLQATGDEEVAQREASDVAMANLRANRPA
jgi:hypothetical protein